MSDYAMPQTVQHPRVDTKTRVLLLAVRRALLMVVSAIEVYLEMEKKCDK